MILLTLVSSLLGGPRVIYNNAMFIGPTLTVRNFPGPFGNAAMPDLELISAFYNSGRLLCWADSRLSLCLLCCCRLERCAGLHNVR